jgi:hypothetical protein
MVEYKNRSKVKITIRWKSTNNTKYRYEKQRQKKVYEIGIKDWVTETLKSS